MKSSEQPRPSSGFSGWVCAPARKQLVVDLGELRVSDDPSTQLVTYALGSCVSVVLYDPVAKVGGMLHAMLPDSTIGKSRVTTKPHMFVDTGVPALFHAAYDLGASKARLIVRVCGGAAFLDQGKIFNIGQRNIDATMAVLARNGVRVAASSTGGCCARTPRLELATGELTVEVPGERPFIL